jgi:alpha-tubulin suppressor-like RCC1 family protein
MKRYTLLILTVLMLAPLLPFAEPFEILEEARTQNQTSGFYSAELADSTLPIIKTASAFSCSLANNEMKCWGNSMSGQLGIGSLTTQITPQPVSFGFGAYATEISLGYGEHACAIINDGSARCWGAGQFGKIGDGTGDNKQSPSPVAFSQKFASNTTATAISAGDQHTCAILNYGNVSCWGRGAGSAIGIPLNNNDQNFPQPTNSLGVGRTALNISLGYQFACAILDNGLVSCWGGGGDGQMGNGNNAESNPIPTPTSSLGANRTAVAIASGTTHTCVILDNGSVSCWGQNSYGALGRGTEGGYSSNPALTNSLGPNRTAVSISAGYANTCVVLDNGEAKCWGYNGAGQLGDGTTTSQYSPTTVLMSSELRFSSIDISSGHNCAVFENGHATCWGYNTYGQYGDGSLSTRIVPLLRYSEQTQIYNVENSAVENLPVSFRLQGTIFDDMNLSSSNVSIDLPVGLNFNPNNKTITGLPGYTAQTNWNITISNGTQQRTAIYELQILADTDGDGTPNTLDTDDDGDGFGDPTDACPTQFGNSTADQFGCPDDDGDGYSNIGDAFANDATQFTDADQDGFGDNASGNLPDGCPAIYGDSARGNLLGCPDADGDRWADQIDVFVNDLSQWNDSDGDGFGDSLIGFQGDACPTTIGMSTQDRFGCTDSDGDGWSDDGDLFSNNPTQWADRDGDGYGDNQSETASMSDAFSADGTQWNDTDGDGHGDNPYGTQGDWFPNDATRWQDSDRDGVADEDDAFPNDSSQIIDLDNDGYGDDANGSDPDVFPDDPTEWADTDGDEVGNNADAFPFDPSQQNDSDGDGFGDNERGSGADKFPNDSTQWSDIDGDGYGDNQDGTNPDAFIADPTQWADADGDGYGDNPTGRQADGFTDDATQWLDQDGDGLGDNLSGNNPDPYLFDFDNDGYNDSIDPLPKLASPGDLDNDGTPDVDDLFPEDFREWADSDGDGEGDNADTDDDNDGWADTDELREGTDPFSSSSQPVNSFEIVLPGTTIGLGAWDLIGMFGGIPLFCWIGFGFVTRNGRTAKYETRLREANTRDELEGVARQWEYSLMLRLLGPHQGIRLERLRAELDDRYEAQNQRLSSIEPEPHDQTEMVEQAMNVDEKSVPAIQPDKPAANLSGVADGKGYEWITQDDGIAWFRIENSDSEWELFEA